MVDTRQRRDEKRGEKLEEGNPFSLQEPSYLRSLATVIGFSYAALSLFFGQVSEKW